MRVRAVAPLVGVAVLALAWGAVAALGLKVNRSPSMPRGLYRQVAKTPVAGDVVAVCLPSELARFGRERGYLGVGTCRGEIEPLVKRVAATGGERVRVSAGGVEIAGRRLPASRPLVADRGGRPLRPAWGVHQVPDGAVWLHSVSSPRAWDSRYFGPVPRSAIVAVMEPVWTVEGSDP